MKENIEPEKAEKEYGIVAHHEVMPNGEKRFRLKHKSGDGYIFTVAGTQGGWQSSHSHRSLTEHYLVDTGWMALARWEAGNGVPDIEVLYEGDFTNVNPTVPHNVYLPRNASVHTIKVNSQDPADWIPEPDLDEYVSNISEQDILRILKDRM